MKYDCLVVHYSEIGIKGKNRKKFEEKLMGNLKKLGLFSRVYKVQGRIICNLKEENEEKVKERVMKIPGIAYFSFSLKSATELEKIEKKVIAKLKNEKFLTFKINTIRADKRFNKTSQEVNEIIGKAVVEKLGKKAKMKNPDMTVFIEITEKEAFIYFEKIKGIGGLPITSSGKVVCLLSGGIDSPVAGFMMMKRGCEVVFVHAHNETKAKASVKSKIKKIVSKLTEYQLNSKLYMVPFSEIQKQIILKVPAKYRMIVYRRFMIKIANEISEKENCKAIVTGDSVGQVASQTLENLEVVYEAAEKPVIPPLIGMNKEEITCLAKQIGTYEYSIIPYPDCCSFMIAKHPETKARLKEILEYEKNIKENIVKESVEKAEVIHFKV